MGSDVQKNYINSSTNPRVSWDPRKVTFYSNISKPPTNKNQQIAHPIQGMGLTPHLFPVLTTQTREDQDYENQTHHLLGLYRIHKYLE